MINEPIRLLADWLSGTLKDASNVDRGLNVQLAALTTDDSDPAPPAVTVVDETREGPAARNEPGDELPALIVSLQSLSAESTTMSPATGPRQIPLTVGFRYVAKEGVSATAVAQAYYTAQAIMMSWSYLVLPANEAKRVRNGVTIIPYSDPQSGFDLQPVLAQREDDHVSIGLTLRLLARRTIP